MLTAKLVSGLTALVAAHIFVRDTYYIVGHFRPLAIALFCALLIGLVIAIRSRRR